MAADPTTLKVSPNTITQITAIKRNGTAITPITYNGTSGSSYSTFSINDFLSGDIVTFSSEGYSNLDVTIGTSEVVNFTEGYQTIAFYKHAGVTYEIEDEKARQDIATKQDALTTQTVYSSKGSSTKVPQITTNNLGQVTNITEVTISQPTVNNKTITIQKNSTTVDSFTLNQSTDKTINITVPTKTSDITNDSGFLTSHQSIKTLKTDNTTTQTASSSEAIAGSGTINLHKVSKTGSYNDLLDKPTIPTVNNSTITIQKNGTDVDSFTTNQSSNKSINITVPTTAADVGAQAAGNYISYTNNTATVAGASKTVSKTNPETLFVPNGLIMGGTAAAAGLVTRGVCGVSSPTATGAATKDNLYINYDSTNTYSSTRQVVIQAGSVGTHYGNNLYQYAAARGDAVKNYADATYTPLTRKINNKALSADITLTASDVSAVASNTVITGATKCKITYDSKGLVTAGEDLSAGDIPDLSATYLTSHQSIKSIKSDNTTAQSTSSSEAVAGSGTINLHKIAKTGTFSDLLSKPTSISGYGITDAYTKTEIDGMISSVYKPAGSVAFASLPTLASGVLGNVYNVTDAFTTTTNFVEGAGKSYPAGTNVVVVNTGTTSNPTYKFDVLAGFVDLSGYVPTSRTVNGKALSANISLTASDVGAISSHQSIKTLKTDNTTAQSTSSSETIAGSGTINLHKVSKTGSYNDLLNKPTIPATNVIPATTTANKVLVSTTTSGTAKWSDFSTAGLLKTNTSGVISVDTTSYGTYSKPSGGIPASDLAESYYLASNPSGYTSNAGTVTSVRVQATSPVQSSTSTAQSTTLNTTISLADGYGDTKNPYASKTKNYVLAAPSTANGAPTFRALEKSDIPLASETAASGGTTTSLVTTGEKYIWDNKQDAGDYIEESDLEEIDINNLVPDQSGNSGKFLTTNGSTVSWASTSTTSVKTLNTTNTTAQTTSSSEAIAGSGTINLHKVSKTGSYDDLNNKPTIPQGTVTSVRVQAGTGLASSTSTAQSTTLNTTISIASGYKLPTTTEWGNKQDALPSQSGQSGKFLTTNGSTVSWATASTNIDNSTITKNGSDQIQTIGYKDVRTNNTLKTWTGTKAQYDAIATKDANTLYNITDDTDTTLTVLNTLYPVGAVYIGTMDTCPLATLGIGSWELQTSRFLVEKQEITANDPSWYNLYSDGYCEQGGFASASGFISFIKPYSSANFNFLFNRHYPEATSAGSGSTSTANHNTVARSTQYGSTTGAGAYLAMNDENGCDGCDWIAWGYTSTTSNIKMWRRIS